MNTFVNDLWDYLKEQTAKGRKVVLYGTGNGADKIIAVLEERGIPVDGIFASPGFVRDRSFHGMKVRSFDDLFSEFGNEMIVLMCFGSSRPDVLSYADEISSKCELYAPDVPVYGNNLFDIGFYNAHKDELSRVRQILSDDLSVRTLDDVISARLTGDIKYLKDCEVSIPDADSLIKPSDSGLFIDLGAYNGDTVNRFSKVTGITGIVAVEPDRRNMRKLRENTAALPIDIEYVQAFISDKDGTAFTDRNLGRGTSLDKDGTAEVSTVTIDGLSGGRPVSFIKFDVEGAELAALEGGAETIAKYKPVMCIACYHRSEDLFALPSKVLELNPGYRVLMRHTPSIPAWDTCFYFM